MRGMLSPVLAVLLLLAAQPVLAQSLSGGYKVGPAFSNFAGEDVDFDNRTAVITGGFVNMRLSETFSLQAEALYVGKGAHKSEYVGSLGQAVNYKRDFDYIEVPLLVRYRPPLQPRASATATFHAGVAPSVLLRAQMHEDGLARGANRHDYKESMRDLVSTFDVGLVLGAGVDILLYGFQVIAEGRFTAGLMESHSQDVTERAGFAGMSVQNRSLAVLIGVGYPW